MPSRSVPALSALIIAFLCLVTRMVAPQQDDSPQQTSREEEKGSSAARASEESSSKHTRVDLSPPKDDAKNHPMSGAAISDAQESASDVQEFHPWDPHKAVKDVEVVD